MFQVHFYCPSCLFYLGESRIERLCESCDRQFNADECTTNGNYFLYLPMEGQIRDLLLIDKLNHFLTNHATDRNDRNTIGVISDITSGKMYNKLVEDRNFSHNDLSLTWNTDGIPVFESSNYSIWPVQSAINELPPHLREKHILLHGLWFGTEKPAMNTFLKPFVEECKLLETRGLIFENDEQPRKVFAHILSADSPARAIVKNCKQFNGKHGCDWCEFAGETIDGGPPTRYYPYRGPPKMRTAEKQVKYGLQAIDVEDAVKGVKGPSVVGILPSFNQVQGKIPITFNVLYLYVCL